MYGPSNRRTDERTDRVEFMGPSGRAEGLIRGPLGEFYCFRNQNTANAFNVLLVIDGLRLLNKILPKFNND